jgi:hypothetical protein
VAEQVGVSGDSVLEMESLICDVDRTIIEAKLAVNVNMTAVQKVVTSAIIREPSKTLWTRRLCLRNVWRIEGRKV